MNKGTGTPTIAVFVHGSAMDAGVTVHGLKATVGPPHTVYLVLDGSSPSESLNRAAAQRTEEHLVFLDAGLTPMTPNWLSAMWSSIGPRLIGAAVGSRNGGTGSPIAGLLTQRSVFDLLGGFDADRCTTSGYYEDYIARLIGLGYECVAPASAVFLAGAAQLKREC
jgi:hypothetical protein